MSEPADWLAYARAVATRTEPPSEGHGGPAVTPLVVAALEARSEVGVERYGQELGVRNGREAVVDALQEALDLPKYLMQLAIEIEMCHRLMDDLDIPKRGARPWTLLERTTLLCHAFQMNRDNLASILEDDELPEGVPLPPFTIAPAKGWPALPTHTQVLLAMLQERGLTIAQLAAPDTGWIALSQVVAAGPRLTWEEALASGAGVLVLSGLEMADALAFYAEGGADGGARARGESRD